MYRHPLLTRCRMALRHLILINDSPALATAGTAAPSDNVLLASISRRATSYRQELRSPSILKLLLSEQLDANAQALFSLFPVLNRRACSSSTTSFMASSCWVINFLQAGACWLTRLRSGAASQRSAPLCLPCFQLLCQFLQHFIRRSRHIEPPTAACDDQTNLEIVIRSESACPVPAR